MAIITRSSRAFSDTIDHHNRKQQLIKDHDHTKLVRLKPARERKSKQQQLHQKPQRQQQHQLEELPEVMSTEIMIQMISSQARAAFACCMMLVVFSILLFAQTCQCDTLAVSSQMPSLAKTKQLLSLADIERQHFGFQMGPINSLFIDKRPSKFDYEYHGGASSDSEPIKSGSSVKRDRSPTRSTKKSGDDEMRQIMMMHEQIAGSHSPSRSSSSSNSNINKNDSYNQVLSQHMAHSAIEPTKGGQKTEVNHLQGRWRNLVKSPVRAATNFIGQPNKLVSQVFSFVTPLIGAVNVNSTRARALTTFYGRALGGAGGKPSKLETTRPSLTSMPQNMFLNKPEVPATTMSETHQHKSRNQQRASTTQATGNGHSNPSSLAKMAIRMAKKTLPSSDDIIKDLLADSSSIAKALAENPLGTAFGASKTSTSSLLPKNPSFGSKNKSYSQEGASPFVKPNEQSLTHEGEGNAAKTIDHPIKSNPESPSTTPTMTTSSNSWIRRQTNQKALNYLQDSLRDLILLSQLPILQSDPISTAPSVLERGGKLYGVKKSGNVTGLSSGGGSSSSYIDHVTSLRAIDELLRLAYILTTGVRRKRDPLKALAPTSNSLISTSNQMASVLSARSLKQLMMPNYNNNRSLTTYATDTNKRLRSIILSSLPKNGAKPRGVVWDMATDPSLAVTVFHLIERASVALPLGK